MGKATTQHRRLSAALREGGPVSRDVLNLSSSRCARRGRDRRATLAVFRYTALARVAVIDAGSGDRQRASS